MILQKTKIFLLGLTAIIAVAGALFFPANGTVQSFLSGIVFLTLFPYLVIKFVFKEPVSAYGLTLPTFTKKLSFQIALLFFLALGIFLLLFAFTPLGNFYFPPAFLSQGFFLFFLYSLLGGCLFSLMFSSFFQGFLFFFFRNFGKEWAILVQWVCFILFLFLIGKLNWSMAPYIYVALFSGTVVSLSRSFPVGFLFTWFFVILADMLLLKFF